MLERRRDGAVEAARPDFAAYGDALRRYFAKRVMAAEIDDLVQEVFLKMHARVAAEPIANVQGYIFRVASSVLMERHARMRRHGQPMNSDAGIEPASTITPERSLIARQDAELIIAALDRLPSRTRHIFLLHRLEGKSYADIAGQFGISVSSVEKHMMKAIALIVRARRRIGLS